MHLAVHCLTVKRPTAWGIRRPEGIPMTYAPEPGDLNELEDNRLQVLDLICHAPGISAKEISAQSGFHRETVRRWAKKLECQGFITRQIRYSPPTHYFFPSTHLDPAVVAQEIILRDPAQNKQRARAIVAHAIQVLQEFTDKANHQQKILDELIELLRNFLQHW